MPRCYSYVRFSHSMQERGSSVARQVAKAEAWAAANHLTLDDSFRLSDLGVSAFRSRNVKSGALSFFLAAVKEGKVPRGSFLIVESLDRLSRAQISDAMELFMGLVKAGVNLVTLDPPRVHTLASMNDVMGWIEPLIIMSRANEESEMKSSRIKTVWAMHRDKARDGKGRHQNKPPYWLARDKVTGGYVAIPERVALVKRVFELRTKGYGLGAVVKALNAGDVKPQRSNKWNISTVFNFVRNRQVLGEYVPCRKVDGKHVPVGEAIPGYYPAIIDEATYYAAQGTTAPRGRNPEGNNVVQGIVFNGFDGHSMNMLTNVQTHKDGRKASYVYLVSSGHRTGVKLADKTRISYPAFEAAFLSFVAELNPSDFMPATHEDVSAKIADLAGKIAAADHKIATLKARWNDKGEDFLLDMVAAQEAAKRDYAETVEELRSQESHHATDNLGEIHTLAGMLAAADEAEAKDLRVRIRGRVRHLIKRVVVYPKFERHGFRKQSLYTVLTRVEFHDGRTRTFLSDHTGKVLDGDILDPAIQVYVDQTLPASMAVPDDRLDKFTPVELPEPPRTVKTHTLQNERGEPFEWRDDTPYPGEYWTDEEGNWCHEPPEGSEAEAAADAHVAAEWASLSGGLEARVKETTERMVRLAALNASMVPDDRTVSPPPAKLKPKRVRKKATD